MYLKFSLKRAGMKCNHKKLNSGNIILSHAALLSCVIGFAIIISLLYSITVSFSEFVQMFNDWHGYVFAALMLLVSIGFGYLIGLAVIYQFIGKIGEYFNGRNVEIGDVVLLINDRPLTGVVLGVSKGQDGRDILKIKCGESMRLLKRYKVVKINA